MSEILPEILDESTLYVTNPTEDTPSSWVEPDSVDISSLADAETTAADQVNYADYVSQLFDYIRANNSDTVDLSNGEIFQQAIQGGLGQAGAMLAGLVQNAQNPTQEQRSPSQVNEELKGAVSSAYKGDPVQIMSSQDKSAATGQKEGTETKSGTDWMKIIGALGMMASSIYGANKSNKLMDQYQSQIAQERAYNQGLISDQVARSKANTIPGGLAAIQPYQTNARRAV